MAYANCLNKTMTYVGSYPASSVIFNIPLSPSTGSDPWFYRSFTASNSVSHYTVTLNNGISFFKPAYNNRLISQTNTGVAMSSLNTTGGTSYVLGSSNRYMTASAAATIVYNGTDVNAGAITMSAASNGGFSSAALTTLSTGYRMDFSLLIGTNTGITNYYNISSSGGTNAAPATRGLPTTASVGDFVVFTYSGQGSATTGAVRITQSAGQYIRVGSSTTTVGTGGYIQNSSTKAISVQLICTEANLGWAMVGAPSDSALIIV